jgi:uncharacterized repeat protein (TIGR01451 family)
MRKYYFLVLGMFLFAGVKAQIINFPDANFKAALLMADTSNNIASNLLNNSFKIDSNSNGEIEVSEALQVTRLYVQNSNISDLTGINYFTNIYALGCNNNRISSLNFNTLTQLKYLDCSQNQLTNLNVNIFTNLIKLWCSNNQLTSLNINSLNNLEVLFCSNNQLTSLNILNASLLKTVDCSFNSLTSLDLSNCSSVFDTLNIQNNFISTINFSNIIKFNSLNIRNNNLKGIDLSNVTYVYWEFLFGNNTSDDVIFRSYFYMSPGGSIKFSSPVAINLDLTNLKSFGDGDLPPFLVIENSPNLEIINLKNSYNHIFYSFAGSDVPGINIIQLRINNCPNLKYFCADAGEETNLTTILPSQVQVNSYCSFTPGGEFYTIQGTAKFDSNYNGCDVSDLPTSNLKFSVTDGTNTGSVIANTTGSYVIPVQAGTHTVIPVIENPSYFSISPSNTVVTFPTQTSPFTQDFCVTANGVHPDLEVAVLPITRARAGFDATYKIIYKNKGNQTQSGSVNLTFNDAVLDLINANPIATTQSTNNLSWNFTDLKPFEIREIELKVNVNSPIETPAVNIDDILSYTATITSTQTDDTPTDNTFTLNQTVVGSFDPNDKTCLEGATIAPSAVGKYVHYLIRFENKGTAEAQNVVVKDMIDTSKFDVNSLVITQGSHPFVTRITETNKVEFIFENINLPFDDATNDGYVAFKIKTKPSLVVGDSFSNTASIYFDYNFPIVTNTATTSVLQSLGNQDFEFDSYFSVYPNPVQNSLNLDIKKQIRLSSISIYNTLGQQILVIPNEQYTKQVDVSNLKTGNYFIKLTSDKGSAIGKFIKS